MIWPLDWFSLYVAMSVIGIFETVVPGNRQSLAFFGNHSNLRWSLVIPGDIWWSSVIFGNCCQSLVIFGDLWWSLVTFGNLWWSLAIFGNLQWSFFLHFFLKSFAIFGKLSLAIFGIFDNLQEFVAIFSELCLSSVGFVDLGWSSVIFGDLWWS